MAKTDGYDPNWRVETPEEKVDRLISEIECRATASACEDLRQALASMSLSGAIRGRASAALKRCQ